MWVSQRAMAILLMSAACSGDNTDESDTEVPDTSCTFVLPPSQFTFAETQVGQTITGTLELMARCPNAIEVSVQWRDPHSGAFQVVGPLTRTLEPGVVVDLDVSFTPAAAQAYEDSLVITPDPSAGGGVITVFEGVGL